MSKIFISYRRDDSSDVTGRIYDHLVPQFGSEVLFKDVNSTPLGVDFRTYLDKQISQCSVFLAVIGREWIGKRGFWRKSRLDDPEDFVRIEIESALKLNIPLIPLLVRGASIPNKESLPISMKALANKNGIPVRSDPDFLKDMDRLIEHLKAHGLSKAHENMVLIPKGPFLYGENKESISIDHDYFMDIYPVTNEYYNEFLQTGGYDNEDLWSKEGWDWKKKGRGWFWKKKVSQPKYWDDTDWNQLDHPVVGVSYFEAEAFGNWAGKRLPTEQEWEKAARGMDGRTYPWGDEFDKKKCNFQRYVFPHNTPVTRYTYGKSPFGCYDMAGNVWEWCASWYDNNKGFRVIRGGSWAVEADDIRSAGRDGFVPGHHNYYIGFRCAQDAR